MTVVALCDIHAERLEAGVRRLGVRGYRDYEEMLRIEELDVVHAVTKPSVPRADWVAPCARSGVKALVIEKPVALMPSEFTALAQAADQCDLRVIVNTQRRYMPFAMEYRTLRADGLMGPAHYVRANSRGNVLDMSPHVMDCALSLVDDSPPVAVWATAEGAGNFSNPDERSPDNLFAVFTVASGARVLFEVTQEPLGTANFPLRETLEPWQPERCNLDVWSSEGRFWWREYGTWGYQLEGMERSRVEQTHFFRDDVQAQHLFTKAIGEWLDDESRPHLNRFCLARMGMECIYAAYKSALEGRRLDLPVHVDDDDVHALRRKLCANQG